MEELATMDLSKDRTLKKKEDPYILVVSVTIIYSITGAITI